MSNGELYTKQVDELSERFRRAHAARQNADWMELKRLGMMKTTWTIIFGSCRHVYYTEYHAEQFARALRLNGTAFKIQIGKAGEVFAS